MTILLVLVVLIAVYFVAIDRSLLRGPDGRWRPHVFHVSIRFVWLGFLMFAVTFLDEEVVRYIGYAIGAFGTLVLVFFMLRDLDGRDR